jgi:L-ascorbate metabolism protein UlaG (beta-lactamase superfamily)
MTSGIRVTLVGGPTAVINIGGVRILTDPTFDDPGPHPVGDRVLHKTAGPALVPGDLGVIDAVLLSHDQHPDNLDDAGRAFLRAVPVVITTRTAAQRLDAPTAALDPWRHVTLRRPDGRQLTVHGVPAVHGPEGTEESSGPVIGFVLAGDDLPVTYMSGDNASLRVVEEVADNLGPVDVAMLHVGRARTERLDAYLTLGARKAAGAAQILGEAVVVPIHADGWAHLTETKRDIVAAFEEAGLTNRLRLLEPGESTEP